jgi:hypothetical protein
VTTSTYELVYQEALRLLSGQESVVDGLRARAGALFATASVSTSFLAGLSLRQHRIGGLAWAAIVAYLVLGLLSVVVLWPWYGWVFAQSPRRLLADYVEADPPVGLDEMYRQLSIHAELHHHANQRRLQVLVRSCEASSALLVVEVLLWVVQLALER